MLNSASENSAFYEIMMKNTAEPDSPQMTIRCIRNACWTTKGKTHTLRICNTYCFPLQQWLQERALMLGLCLLCLSCRGYV
jgi:hypothetical protein